MATRGKVDKNAAEGNAASERNLAEEAAGQSYKGTQLTIDFGKESGKSQSPSQSASSKSSSSSSESTGNQLSNDVAARDTRWGANPVTAAERAARNEAGRRKIASLFQNQVNNNLNNEKTRAAESMSVPSRDNGLLPAQTRSR